MVSVGSGGGSGTQVRATSDEAFVEGGVDAAEKAPEGARPIDYKRAKKAHAERAKKAHAERHQFGEVRVGMSQAISSLVVTHERASTCMPDTEKFIRLASERSN